MLAILPAECLRCAAVMLMSSAFVVFSGTCNQTIQYETGDFFV